MAFINVLITPGAFSGSMCLLSGNCLLNPLLLLPRELPEDRNRLVAGFPALDHVWNRMCTQKTVKELKNVPGGRSNSFEIFTRPRTDSYIALEKILKVKMENKAI